MVKVSVIVPIYNVAGFIRRCADSLMRQTLDDVEFIFVNDCTPDNSMDILKEVVACYPERNVKAISHDVNKGLPSARNTGMRTAAGDYIFHCDSDDFVEPTMLEEMYEAAEENGADIVWCDWYLSFEKNERYMKQPAYADPKEALKAMLTGRMKYNVWNKLVRRSLYEDNQICFPAGYGMGEDMTMMMLFAFAQRVQYLPQAYYHYVKQNSNAFSNTYSSKHIEELKYNVARVEKFIQKTYGSDLAIELCLFKLDVKYPFLITDKCEKYKLWESLYPEANIYLDTKRDVGFRRNILEKCARRHWHWALWAYYTFIHKTVYGIIYK